MEISFYDIYIFYFIQIILIFLDLPISFFILFNKFLAGRLERLVFSLDKVLAEIVRLEFGERVLAEIVLADMVRVAE
jgi:hypothetical protein